MPKKGKVGYKLSMKTTKHQKKKTHHNSTVAKNRGESWRKNLIKGKHEASLNPTKIKLERVRRELSQDVMAKEIAASVNTFGAIERGKRPVNKDRANRIAKRLGRTVSTLFVASGKKFVAKAA